LSLSLGESPKGASARASAWRFWHRDCLHMYAPRKWYWFEAELYFNQHL
jgi:hypothetical protein